MSSVNDSAATRTTGPLRVIAVGLASIIAVVSATVGAIGVWSQTVVLDASGSELYVSRIMDSPDVVRAVGVHLGNQLVDLYDQNISFASRVPEALKDEAEKFDMTITEEIRERSLAVASSDAVRAAFTEALVELHGAIVDTVTTDRDDGEVTVRLNLVPAATALFQSLQESGAWPESPPVPDVDRDASPENQASTLEQALGFDLPDGLSSVEVLREGGDGPDASEVRSWVSSVQVLTWVALAVSATMTALAAIAVRRRRARVWVASAVVVASTASTWVIARQAPRRLESMVDDETWISAVGDVATTLVSPLSNSSVAVALLVVATVGVVEVVSRRRRHDSNRPGSTN